MFRFQIYLYLAYQKEGSYIDLMRIPNWIVTDYLLWCRTQMRYSGIVNKNPPCTELVLQTGFKVVFEFLGRCVILGAQCTFALTTMGNWV